MLARIDALPTIAIDARDATVAGATTLMTPPDPVNEKSTELLAGDDGFVAPTMLTFANGARVVLNPTVIADNDVSFAATSPGGLSLVPDADVPDALHAVQVVTSSGIGDLDPVDLDTVLSDAAIELYPSIGQTSEDFVGSSTTDDLQLLFQLVNLYMSAPRFDQVALDATVSTLQSYVDDPNSDPDLAEYIAYSDARYGAEPRFRVIPTADDLAGLDLATIERVWRDRFTNASDWVFAVSGDFDIDDARDMARRYIGSLSGTDATEHYKDFQVDPPAEVITKEVHAGTGDKGSLTFDWNTIVDTSDTELRVCRRADERVEHPPDGSHPRRARCVVLAHGVCRGSTGSRTISSRPTSTSPAIRRRSRRSRRSSSTTSPSWELSGPTPAEFDSAIAELQQTVLVLRQSDDQRPAGQSTELTRADHPVQGPQHDARRHHPGDVAAVHHRGDASESVHRGPDRPRLTGSLDCR